MHKRISKFFSYNFIYNFKALNDNVNAKIITYVQRCNIYNYDNRNNGIKGETLEIN